MASKVKISTAKRILTQSIKAVMEAVRENKSIRHTPVYLHSSPGMGKSSIVNQITKELKIGFVDVRLAQMEQSDVAGIPYVSHAGDDKEQMKMSVPHWFPSVEKIKAGVVPEFGVLFFDELSNAALGVQHAAYGIILDRMVHGVPMGAGWQIVAAGNLKEDKTGAKGVAPALANRFGTHLIIEIDSEEVVMYGILNGWNKEIVGFLSSQPAFVYEKERAKSELAFCTPRSWEAVNALMNQGYTDSDLLTVMSGCVGDAATTQFQAFVKYYDQLPNWAEVMDGKREYKVDSDNLGLLWAVTSSVISLLVENSKDKKRIGNLEKILDQLPDEHVILIFKSLKNANAQQLVMSLMKSFKRVSGYVTGSN
jgi:hypothetical protein